MLYKNLIRLFATLGIFTLLFSYSAFSQDPDGDGVDAYIDLDNDNDGIPDLMEGCTNSNIANTVGIGNSLASGSTYNFLGTDITYTHDLGANDIKGYVAGTQGDALLINAIPISGLSGNLTIAFSNPVKNLKFKTTDWDASEQHIITVLDDLGSPIDLTTTGINFTGSQIVQTGNTFNTIGGASNTDGNDPADDHLGAIYFFFPGWVSQVSFAVNQPGINSIRMTQMEFCAVDTDSDGIPDFLDLDSDADGCADGIEAAHGQTLGVGDMLSGPFGSNGLANAVETSIDSGIINYVPNFDSQDPSLNCTDIDGDAVFDQHDVDADNDGLPNFQEIPCNSISESVRWYHNTAGEPSIQSPSIITSAAYELAGSGLTLNHFGTTLSVENIDAATLAEAIVLEEYVEYSMTTVASLPDEYRINHIEHYVINADKIFKWSMYVSDDGFSTQRLLMKDIDPSASSGYTNWQIHESVVYFLENSKNYKFRIYFYAVAPAQAGKARWDDPGFQLCASVKDNDGDLIWNHIDLDSDNDGIYDVLEAGGTDPDIDGIIGTGPITDTDGDGWSNITDPNNGGTPLADTNTDGDGDPDRIDLDSDNDNCYDVVEGTFTDFNDDGILGNIPVTVDASGKVTSGIDGYSSPGTDYTNGVIKACFELCGNAIDDNGDGRTDEPYPGMVQDNMLLWLKADAGFSATTWTDQSLKGNDASVFGDPTQVANSLNFNPGINFDGDDHVEVNLPELRFDGGTHHVGIFAVYQPSTTATNIGIFGNQLTSNGTIEMYNNSIGLGYGSLGMGIAYGDSPHLVSYVIDEEDNVGGVAFSSPFYHNGGLVLSNTFNETNINQTSNTFHIGRSGTFFGSQYFLGDIQEVIIYYENDGNTAITDAERQKIESYLSVKYGISIAHDYTDSQ